MKNDRRKDSFNEVPVEKHDTAAWSDIHKQKNVSNVAVPSEFSTKNAKDYVDSNEK